MERLVINDRGVKAFQDRLKNADTNDVNRILDLQINNDGYQDFYAGTGGLDMRSSESNQEHGSYVGRLPHATSADKRIDGPILPSAGRHGQFRFDLFSANEYHIRKRRNAGASSQHVRSGGFGNLNVKTDCWGCHTGDVTFRASRVSVYQGLIHRLPSVIAQIPFLHVDDRERQQRFLGLYSPISDRLARYVRAMTADADEALDVVSETVMIAYQKMHTVRNPDSFLGFVLTIARNVHIRSRRRASIFRPIMDTDADNLPALDPSPEESADVRLLYDTLAQLPDRQREAVILFEIVGLPLEQISSIQGGTLSGVKARVVRGRHKLTELLRPETVTTAPKKIHTIITVEAGHAPRPAVIPAPSRQLQ